MYTPTKLKVMPTLATVNSLGLKVDDGQTRVWLEGEATVYIEKLIAGKWKHIVKYGSADGVR